MKRDYDNMIPGSKAPKAVRACTIRFLSLGPAKTLGCSDFQGKSANPNVFRIAKVA